MYEALREEMERDPSIFALGEDVAVWGGGDFWGVTKGLSDLFGPARVCDTWVSKETIVAVAVSAAATGMRPVAK